MADEDFNLDTLATYLHLLPAQVLKLTERGDLPGRRVGGQWIFTPAEIHHWLERRIGVSDDEALAQMEARLKPAGLSETPLVLAEMLTLPGMAVPLQARTRASVIAELVDLAAKTTWVWDTARMLDAVRAREDMHPTALENGVAFLHSRRPLPMILDRPLLAYGRTETGIPFGSRGLTDIFFLICSVEDRGHLRALARLSRLVGDAALLTALRQAPDAPTTHALLIEADERL